MLNQVFARSLQKDCNEKPDLLFSRKRPNNYKKSNLIR
jgi:hypothetical protein